ncbi:MAG: response regulator [Methanoregula sp.]|jgi:CheY-like chemotaxis protein
MTRILIADDNPQNLYLLESILKGFHYEVVSAKNGAEAIAAALNNPPDLIIADILMPVMDGFELCRRWKADEQLKQIPFIFYTATYTDPKDEQFALSLGADRFVTKPQKPEVLGSIVSDTLAEYRKNLSAAEPTLDEMETLRQYNEVLFRKLEKKVKQLEGEIAGHRLAEERIILANRKLGLMTDVTYQDIQNKLTALVGFAEFSRTAKDEQERIAFIDKQREILETIQNLIKKTKDYQQMGIDCSRWIGIEKTIRMQMSLQSQKPATSLLCDLSGLEINTDPLIARVFYNLIHNAIRHGGNVSRITFSFREDPAGLLLICEDDGAGIPADQKPRLFDRVVGGAGKFGLFFVREFLTLSGMAIQETGIPGTGARFEISVPAGMYRFAGNR